MKVLQVNKLYYPWLGGVETVAQDIAEHFNNKEGFSVTNLVCQPRGARKMDAVNGVPTWRAASWGMALSMPVSFDFFALFRRLAKDADVIVLHHPFPLAFVAYRLFGRGKCVVIWYHSDIIRQRFTKLPFMPFIRFALRRAEHIFVSNQAIVRNSKELRSVAGKCRVVYLGIDPARFVPTPAVRAQAEDIRRKYGQPLVLGVGRLIYYKGFSYLIEAMKNVDAHLLIIGKGQLGAALHKQIDELQLGGRVNIIDPVPDLAPYYHACDVFAFPSSEASEMAGIAQIEAMACGKPVVNTALPTGVPEISVDGVTGRTVPPKDSAALTRALNELLSNKDEYAKFSKQAREEVEKRFTKKKFLEEMERYLK